MTTTISLLANYVNGDFNCSLYSDGTFIKQSTVDNPRAAFPSTIDVKITNYCGLGCPYCHEDSTLQGVHGDLATLLEQLSVLPQGIELAIGGGNPLAHPDLEWFLQEVEQQGKYANITVNQGHLDLYKELIERLQVKGIGVSITSRRPIPYWLIDNPHLVFHLIIGVNTKKDLERLLNQKRNPKVLLLGYKSEVGRGQAYYSPTVEENIKEWFIWVRSFFGRCVLSFDNLAIEQLQLQRFFSSTAWSRFFMGEDFTSSMYIDAVLQQYAPTSRSLPKDRVQYQNLLQYWEQTHGSITE